MSTSEDLRRLKADQEEVCPNGHADHDQMRELQKAGE